MKKLLILAAALGLLLALTSPAWSAAFGFSNCRTVAIPPPRFDKLGDVACYEFDDDTDSGQFMILTGSALVCLDPDITTEGVATATVMIRRCHTGTKPGSSPENQCLATLDAPLTGLTGADGTQNACERYGPGAYYVDVVVSAGGDDAIVSITAEGD